MTVVLKFASRVAVACYGMAGRSRDGVLNLPTLCSAVRQTCSCCFHAVNGRPQGELRLAAAVDIARVCPGADEGDEIIVVFEDAAHCLIGSNEPVVTWPHGETLLHRCRIRARPSAGRIPAKTTP